MEVTINDELTARQDEEGCWYLLETRTGRVSQEFFISLEILEKSLNGGYRVTWVEQEREIPSVAGPSVGAIAGQGHS